MVKLPLASQACMSSQGERESGRAGVLDPMSNNLGSSTPKNLRRVQRSENSQVRVRSRESVKSSDWRTEAGRATAAGAVLAGWPQSRRRASVTAIGVG